MALTAQDLISIEDLLDRKLEQKLEEKFETKFNEKFAPIFQELQRINIELSQLRQQVNYLFVRFNELRDDVVYRTDSIKEEIVKIRRRLEEVVIMESEDVQAAYKDVHRLRRDVTDIQGRIARLEG